MFDTLNDIITNIMEPIGETGRNIILAVAVTLLILVICMALWALTKQKWGLLLILVVVGIGLGVLGTQGCNVIKSLVEKQGDDFEGQITCDDFDVQISDVYVFSVISAYMMYRKNKKKVQDIES